MRWVGILVLGAAIGLAAPARAQRGERVEAVAQLDASDPSAVRTALETLGVLGDPRAASAIAERIRRGLPPELLGVAIDTLMVLGSRDAGPVLSVLTRHRRPAVRLKAVQAIATIRTPGAEQALTAALADSDASVRGAAAIGLGTLGATGALDALFQALDRRVPEAATAIGRLARPDDVLRFLGYLGQLSFELVTPALSEMLMREDLAEPARLTIVHRLSELGTPGVRAFFEQLVASLPDSPVRRAAEEAIPRIGR